MRHLPTLLAAVLAASPIVHSQATAPHPVPPQGTIVFEHVHVIPMDRERVLEDQTVVVRGGRIERIAPSSQVQPVAGAVRVEGRGKFLVPALAEMHAHIPGGQATDAAIERVLFLYAANGLGTVRGMLGHPRHLPLKARVERGEILGPAIYTSGPSLNGKSIPTPEAATAAVKEQKAAGYDFLKIHPGVSRPAFDALAATASQVGIRFAGHVPADVGLARALEARYATIDHLDGYVEALAGAGGPTSQMFGLNLVGSVDEAKLPGLVDATKKAGVAQVPTMSLLEHWLGPDDPDAMTAWPEMRFVPKAQLEEWVETKRKFAGGASEEDRKKFLELRRRILKALHDGGVQVLLGSDGPQVWNVPGFSVHRELRYMVAAGMTPWQALESGTRAVAAYFGMSADRGTIQHGKRADLVLLDGNPLQDIGNTSKISAVVLNGRLLTAEAIKTRLDGIAAEVAKE